MNISDYADSTGYLRVVEKRILTTGNFERIIEAPNGVEALKMLSQNSDYDFSSLEHGEDYELILKAELKRVYSTLYKLAPDRILVDVLSTKYDFHNIKVAIKSYFLHENYEDLFISLTNIEAKEIEKVITTKESKELPAYMVLAINAGVIAFQDGKDPQSSDIVLDKHMYGHILELCQSLDIEFITDYIKTSIDFYNIKTLLRVKNMQKGLKFLNDVIILGGHTPISSFTDFYDKPVETIGENFYYKYFGDILKNAMESFEKYNNFSEVEKLTDNYLLNKVKSSKYIAFGPEPLFAYIAAKENEIKQVRILLTCKFNNISSEILRERLRDNYA